MYVSDHPTLNSKVCHAINKILKQNKLLRSKAYYLDWRYCTYKTYTYIGLVLYIKGTFNTFKELGIKRTEFFKELIPNCIIDHDRVLLTEDNFDRLYTLLRLQGYIIED